MLRPIVELQDSIQLQETGAAEKQRYRMKETEVELKVLRENILEWKRKYEEINDDHDELV